MRSSIKPALYRDFFPRDADFFYRNAISNYGTKQSAKFKSNLSSRIKMFGKREK